MNYLKELKSKISVLPDSPGVYLMKDAAGEIIYIGKAKSLKKRVSQYFQNKNHDFKTQKLVEKIRDFDVIYTPSEEDALILEASLVRKNQPYYNIELRDDTSFPFIKITKEEFPRLSIVRPKVKDNSFYYGPYTDATLLRKAFKDLRKIFPFCTCKAPSVSCLYRKINLCPASDENSITQYKKNIANIKLFLEGRRSDLMASLNKQMLDASSEHNFEEAARLRDKIEAFSSLAKGVEAKGVEELARVLRLVRTPNRIEAFDISNISGQQAVGSMVSFYNGLPDKNNYRRFRIKLVKGIDDYKMLGEVIFRRYRRLVNEKRSLPDLILVDGGKGQLRIAKMILDELNLKIPLMALAKQQEEIFTPNKIKSIKLPASSSALQLVRRVRDEAHRFAVKYHKLLRKKEFIN